MSHKPRVAILHYAAPPTIGGVETTIAAHARLFADHGYAVKGIAGRGKVFDSRVPVEIIPEADSKSPRVLEVNAELARGVVSEKFHVLANDLTRKLTRSLAKCDVLIAHNALSLHKNLALTAALKNLADAHKIKIIAWCHDFAWSDPQYASDVHRGAPWDLLNQPWSDVKYVVVSEARREELRKLWSTQFVIPSHALSEVEGEARNLITGNETLRGVYTERSASAQGDKLFSEIAVVPPGMDAGDFLGITKTTARWVRALALLDAAPLLLLPARLTRRKNIERAMEITAALIERGMNAKLIVTGPPGPHNPNNAAYLERLRTRRKSLGAEDAIIFLHEFGAVRAAELRDLYLLADALLFPSEREGFGIPLLEAGLARLPIFCADLSPLRETAREHVHYFSPDEPADAIAVQIATFFKNDLVYQMKRRVVTEFGWERIFVQQIETLL